MAGPTKGHEPVITISCEASLAEVRAERADDRSRVGQAALTAAQAVVDDRRRALVRLETELRDGRADGLTPGSWQAGLKDMADEGKDVAGDGFAEAAERDDPAERRPPLAPPVRPPLRTLRLLPAPAPLRRGGHNSAGSTP